MIREPRALEDARAAIGQFLRAHVAAARASGLVVGMSGGIDSALVATLAAEALGAGRVQGVLLPDPEYPAELLAETRAHARALGIESRTLPLGDLEDAGHALLPELTDPVAWGNVRARLRMILLYACARERGALVAGTGNKSEILLGYYTKYGDGGVDLQPLGDLYKTEVRRLAEQVGVPAPIRARAPSAGLWAGQTDESELGFTYESVDPVLEGLERLEPPEAIAERTGVPLALVEAVAARILQHRHKRVPVPIPKLSLRTVGLDWRD